MDLSAQHGGHCQKDRRRPDQPFHHLRHIWNAEPTSHHDPRSYDHYRHSDAEPGAEAGDVLVELGGDPGLVVVRGDQSLRILRAIGVDTDEPIEMGLFDGVLDEVRIENPAAPLAGVAQDRPAEGPGQVVAVEALDVRGSVAVVDVQIDRCPKASPTAPAGESDAYNTR